MTKTIAKRRKEQRARLIRLATYAVIFIIAALIIVVLFKKSFGNADNAKQVNQLNEQISTLQKQNDELTAQKAAMQAELTEVQVELSNLKQSQTVDPNSLISAMFWGDDNFYVDTNGTEFYSEPTCETSLGSDLKFVSPVVCYDIELKNGQTVNAVLSEQGLVYSVHKPNLEVYEEE